MERLAQTDGLTDIQRDILPPSATSSTRRSSRSPQSSTTPTRTRRPRAQAKDLGLFGLTIGEEYGGLGESLLTYALVVEELSRGWISLSGILNTHFIVAYLVATHGTQEQRDYFLPRMATGEIRSALSMSEPGLGSDVAAIRTAAVRDGDDYVITGQKMWLTTAPPPASSSCSPGPTKAATGRTRTSPLS